MIGKALSHYTILLEPPTTSGQVGEGRTVIVWREKSSSELVAHNELTPFVFPPS